jgi:hypothetical protein
VLAIAGAAPADEVAARRSSARRLAGEHDWRSVAERYERVYERAVAAPDPVRP